MYFAVKARFNTQTAAEFLRKLTDGTIQNQKPDGSEIVKSMDRAKIDESGVQRRSGTNGIRFMIITSPNWKQKKSKIT